MAGSSNTNADYLAAMFPKKMPDFSALPLCARQRLLYHRGLARANRIQALVEACHRREKDNTQSGNLVYGKIAALLRPSLDEVPPLIDDPAFEEVVDPFDPPVEIPEIMVDMECCVQLEMRGITRDRNWRTEHQKDESRESWQDYTKDEDESRESWQDYTKNEMNKKRDRENELKGTLNELIECQKDILLKLKEVNEWNKDYASGANASKRSRTCKNNKEEAKKRENATAESSAPMATESNQP